MGEGLVGRPGQARFQSTVPRLPISGQREGVLVYLARTPKTDPGGRIGANLPLFM